MHEQLHELHELFPSIHDAHPAGSAPSSREPSPHFDGDFFGQYSDEDLPWQDSDSDSESDTERYSARKCYEPPLSPTPTPVSPSPPPLSPPPPPPPPPSQPAHEPPTYQPAARPDIPPNGPTVLKFTKGNAGAPIDGAHALPEYEVLYARLDGHDPANVYAPFTSEMDWKFAKWAKLRGPSSTAVAELLDMPGFAQMLGLSYKNVAELNTLIDQLPGRPTFQHEEIEVAGEVFDIYFRDVLECIRALYSNHEFAHILVFIPERHYADKDMTMRLYHDMHTGRWWWQTQEELESKKPGATIIPIIISSDKTQLTSFGNKTAYPVYITIGNLPKEIRRKPSHQGQILLAYLPTTRLEHIKNKAARRRTATNLFHMAMRLILDPLKQAGADGINMASGDGIVRRVHPIFATFVGDYPEQLLVTCCMSMRCPRCTVPRDKLGENAEYPFRDLDDILDILAGADDNPTQFAKDCADANMRPVQHPFWEELPYTNIFRSITPDILHQLYQGVIKHLVLWLRKAYGDDEIDARCRRLPPNHSLRFFKKGISSLSRITGKEHRDMCRILLGLIIDLPLPGGLHPGRLVTAVRSLLDFLHLARYPIHSDATLKLLDKALDDFHANKAIFIQLGIRDNFDLPKLHFLKHYLLAIKIFGTLDNYNTEYTERLHIDFAKDAYRATNHRDEYPQMARWLMRKEKVSKHQKFIDWRLNKPPTISFHVLRIAPIVVSFDMKLAQTPSARRVSFASLASDYGAADFHLALSRFVLRHRFPTLNTAQINRLAASFILPLQHVAVFHKVRFLRQGVASGEAVDAVHARPKKKGHPEPRFDTALIDVSSTPSDDEPKITDTRVAQVRVIFQLSASASHSLGLTNNSPVSLAYIQWFSVFTSPERHHKTYKITRSMKDKKPVCEVIPIAKIRRSMHLFPKFGPVANRAWSTFNVLDECATFYLNPFKDDPTFYYLF
ncbi:hypothetical protein BOTBODRAFT_100224 [Botryobasidium botryosum FD-172 SS1]|uniref:DUF6830 domain-containing protein n=1 Tax=Botryobasidium botryosum (strain FD-172 SS1) TaxID=930990 RepID=A0A067MXD2_BOTB1|nr:hypothetical protein BOTBODRAFT_100224 [Botryobasidium botryosum FD-172 SS1]